MTKQTRSRTSRDEAGPDDGETRDGETVRDDVTAHVSWDDTTMQSTYANVINVINTREEFSLFFGQNQTWDLSSSRDLVVKLGNRVVMSPYAVKRLHILLGARLAAYEARFGTLDVAG